MSAGDRLFLLSAWGRRKRRRPRPRDRFAGRRRPPVASSSRLRAPPAEPLPAGFAASGPRVLLRARSASRRLRRLRPEGLAAGAEPLPAGSAIPGPRSCCGRGNRGN